LLFADRKASIDCGFGPLGGVHDLKSKGQFAMLSGRIKRFLGTSENAVKTQIWCAVATYVLIAIVKK
jgi:hypothetical protein